VETGQYTLYQTLKSIFLHIDNREKALLGKFDLSVARFYTLMHIHNHPGINYIDLSDLMLCTKSNTTRVVSSMQADGYIERRDHPDDGRSYQLYLTDKGEGLFLQVQPRFLAHIDHLMSSFDDAQLKDYTAASKHIERVVAPDIIVGGSK